MNREMKEVSILEMAQGAVQEQLQYETGKVIRNILDPNTDPKALRSITVKLSFKPNEARENVVVQAKCESKLAPITPVETMLFVSESGESAKVMEWSRQIDGQTDFSGEEIENKLIRIV